MTLETISCERFTWRLRINQRANLPRWKGSMLRGCLGHGLLKHAVALPPPAWPGCEAADLYQALFDPQTAWGDSQATQPWSPLLSDTRTHFDPEECIDGAFMLFGTWPEWAIDALHEAFAIGISRGLGKQRTAASLVSWQREILPDPGIPAHAKAVRLTTRSPCHLQDNRVRCATLNACAIARSLLRRHRQLYRQLVAATQAIDDAAYRQLRNEAAAFDQIIIESHTADARRNSSRQGQHTLPGLEGSIVIHGQPFTPWAPLLAQAPQLLIGNKPSFGFGQVDLEWLDENELSEMHQQATKDNTKEQK